MALTRRPDHLPAARDRDRSPTPAPRTAASPPSRAAARRGSSMRAPRAERSSICTGRPSNVAVERRRDVEAIRGAQLFDAIRAVRRLQLRDQRVARLPAARTCARRKRSFPANVLSGCVQTTTASSDTGAGRPSTGICSTDFVPVSSGLSWRNRAPFAEMSQTATGDAPNVAASGGASRKRSAVRRLRAGFVTCRVSRQLSRRLPAPPAVVTSDRVASAACYL